MPKRASGASRLIRPLVSLLALIAVAAASAATTWLWTSRDQQPMPAEGAAKTANDARPGMSQPAPPPIFLGLDAFTVTLQNSSIERMVHLRLTLRMEDDASRERIERYMPEARSRILMVLSEQSPDAIVTQQGKMDLAQAIQKTLVEPFKPLNERQSVRDVLFTEFVVQ